jgi:signal transduction histidine kinase
MRSSTDGPPGHAERPSFAPVGLGCLAVLLLAVAIAAAVADSDTADVLLFVVSAGIGVAALALGVLSWRRIARSQAEAEERSRRDTEMLDSMLLMLDREREAVAHDLHDGPQQLVAAIRLMADAVAHAVREGDRDRAVEALRRMEEHAGEAAEELRRTTRRLHPVVLEQRGLLAALQALQEMVEEQYGVSVRLQRPEGEWRAQAKRDAALYGLARDAAVGAAEAGARSVRIALHGDGKGIELVVESDGPLSQLPQAGLRTELLRARAARIGGTLETARTEGGERVVVRAP